MKDEIEAERGKGENTVLKEQNLISNISNSFSSCLLDLKIRWFFMFGDFRKWFYCNRGLHRLTKGFSSWQYPDKPLVEVHYLKCVNCNYVFFANIKDREIFKGFEKGRRKVMNKFFDEIRRKVMTGESDAQT